MIKKSGIYIVRLKQEDLMPVTRDPRYVDTCSRVNNKNIKIGKAKDFSIRHQNYINDFDVENIDFQPLAILDDIVTAEKVILQVLKDFRKKSPKGGKLEWLEGISYEQAVSTSYQALISSGMSFTWMHSVHDQ